MPLTAQRLTFFKPSVDPVSTEGFLPLIGFESRQCQIAADGEWSLDQIALLTQQLEGLGLAHLRQAIFEFHGAVIHSGCIEEFADFTIHMPQCMLELIDVGGCLAYWVCLVGQLVFVQPIDGAATGATFVVDINFDHPKSEAAPADLASAGA